MEKMKDIPVEDIKDAALGYTTLVLAVVVFLLFLCGVITLIRIFAPVG